MAKISATFAPDTMQARPLALNVALLGNDLESDVKRGENSGRKLRHDFVVLQLAKSEMTNQGNRLDGNGFAFDAMLGPIRRPPLPLGLNRARPLRRSKRQVAG